jgi:cytochrome c oxidase subunit 2
VSARRHFVLVGLIWAVLSAIGIALVSPDPVIASQEAEIENAAFVVLTAASVPVLLLVVVPALYAALRFRARGDEPDADGPPIHGHPRFELAWVALSLAAVLGLAVYGSIGLLEIRGGTDATVEVRAVASQWSWKFEYPDLGVESKELTLPVGQRAHITIVAKDVVHAFSVPAFGVKKDAVPGRETYIYVTPTFTGEYTAQCAEMCGLGHTRMLAAVPCWRVGVRGLGGRAEADGRHVTAVATGRRWARPGLVRGVWAASSAPAQGVP